MAEHKQQRVTLLVAEGQDRPASVETLSASVRAALPWEESFEGRPTKTRQDGEAARSDKTTRQLTPAELAHREGMAAQHWPNYFIRPSPILFPAGDVIMLIVVATPEQVQDAIDSLQAAGLQVSRGDDVFRLHGK